MNCCNDAGDCRQGRDCPARVCRQRAGKPADYNQIEIWQQYHKDAEEEDRQWKSDLRSIVFIASCVLTFFIIVLVTMP
jgi:hypothetical protein